MSHPPLAGRRFVFLATAGVFYAFLLFGFVENINYLLLDMFILLRIKHIHVHNVAKNRFEFFADLW